MPALGFATLGAFIGYFATFGLLKVQDWSSPVPIVSGLIAAAIGGSIFVFLKYLSSSDKDQSKIFYYPIGLAYGALCAHLPWLAADESSWSIIKGLHIFIFSVATLVVLLLFFWPAFRKRLPGEEQSPSD